MDRVSSRRLLMFVAFIFIALVSASSSYADVLAQSRFDVDTDGWVVKDLLFPNPGVPPAPVGTYAPAHNGNGGNPAGHLSMTDPTANAWYWFAPAKFLGNKRTAYGGTLSFDLSVTGTGSPFDEEDVILVGGGLTLVFTLPARPAATFTTYHIALSEVGWKRDTRAGAPATQLEMVTALGGLTALYIRGEYLLNSDDIGKLDNVVLEGTGACDIQLNQTTFHDNEQVVAQVFRFGNSGTVSLPVEIKVWLEIPGLGPIAITRAGADGSVQFPAGLDFNRGPLPLFTVTPSSRRGIYAFSCRLLDPITGQTFSEDLNPFEIQ